MKIQAKRINIMIFITLLIFSITLTSPVIATKSTTSSFVDIDTTIDTPIIIESDLTQNFTSANEAVEFAYNKINKTNSIKIISTGNFTTIPSAVRVVCNSNYVSTSITDKDGNISLEDIVVTTPSFVNATAAVKMLYNKQKDMTSVQVTKDVKKFVATYPSAYHLYNSSEIINDFGFIDNKTLFTYSNFSIKSVQKFIKNNDGTYSIDFTLNTKTLTNFKRKIMSIAELDIEPVINSLTVSCIIDRYGNFQEVNYDLSGSVTKYIKYGFISKNLNASINGTFKQVYGGINEDDDFTDELANINRLF